MMSGPLRMVIGPTKARLKKLLDDAEDPAISQFVAIDTVEERKDQLSSKGLCFCPAASAAGTLYAVPF